MLGKENIHPGALEFSLIFFIKVQEKCHKFSSNCQHSITLKCFCSPNKLICGRNGREIPDNCIGCQNIFEDSTVVATSGDKYFCPRENSELGMKKPK